MTNTPNITEGGIEQLALLTEVRTIISAPDGEVPDSDILAKSVVLTVIKKMLSLDSQATMYARYLKLESAWILTNLAYGGDSDIQVLFVQDHKEPDNFVKLVK